MKQVGSFEAKTHLAEILAAVSSGEEFIITRHGLKVALLIPYPSQDRSSSVKDAIRAIEKLGSGRTLGKGLSVKKMMAKGRK